MWKKYRFYLERCTWQKAEETHITRHTTTCDHTAVVPMEPTRRIRTGSSVSGTRHRRPTPPLTKDGPRAGTGFDRRLVIAD